MKKETKLLFYQTSLLIMLYIGYGFYYYTRKSITFMMPHFDRNSTNSINITKEDIGIIISSQNIAYALSKFTGGVLSDLFSCRILFGAGLFLSGLLNIGFKKEIQIYSLYSLAFLVGLIQGPAWPCCGKLLQSWLPKSQFGTFWSILATSANVAGAVGPLVATSIALRYHWSYGFMIPGCICMSIGYLCILLIRNRPSEVGLDDFESDEPTHLINSDDEEYSVEETDEEFESMSRFQKMQMIFSYPFFISICLSYFTVQLIKTLFSDWAQIYLIKSVKIDSYTATHFLSLFEFCGIFGSVFSALLTDYILKRQTKAYNEKIASKSTSNGSKKQKSTKLDLQDKPDSTRIRMTTNIFYLIGLLIFMHLFNFYVDKHVDSRFLLLIGSMSGFFAYGSISLLGIMAMEFTSNSFSGTSHGIASLAANFGAIFAGVPFGLISKYYTWNVAFKCVEAFALTILVFLLLFRNSVSKFDDLKSVRVQEKKVQ